MDHITEAIFYVMTPETFRAERQYRYVSVGPGVCLVFSTFPME